MNVRINPRILFACIAGCVLVFGAWYFAEHRPEGAVVTADASIVGETPDRTYIDVRDSNNDGVPDWQEMLYPDAPVLNLDELTTEDYTTPTTTTGRFAVSLAEEVMRSNMYGNFGATPKEIVENGTKQVLDEVRFDLYEVGDLSVSTDTSETALRAYGNAVALIALGNGGQPSTESEVDIVGRALQTNSRDELAKLDPIITGYTTMRDAMLALPIPSSLATEHLALTNTYHALATDIGAFRNLFADPLPALVYLQYYEAHGNALYTAISDLYTALDDAGVKWSSADAVSRFVTVQ